MSDKTNILPVNQLQLFRHSYPVACETYNCHTTSKWFIGRPDAPLATTHRLCEKCLDTLVESILANPEMVERFKGRIKEAAMADQDYEELVAGIRESVLAELNQQPDLSGQENQSDASVDHNSVNQENQSDSQPDPSIDQPKKYQCQYCDIDPFDSFQALGAHVRTAHPKPKE